MSARGSGQVSSKPDTRERPTTTTAATASVIHKQNSGKKAFVERTCSGKSCSFRVPTRSQLSPLRFLKQIGDKIVSALHSMSWSRRVRRGRSSAAAASSGRSNPSIAPLDSHRAEAINDCIQFINSSSSLSRSNSVPSNNSHQPSASS
ncbi:Ubiquitinyl hydrolase 1 [Bertholletia excelsa]